MLIHLKKLPGWRCCPICIVQYKAEISWKLESDSESQQGPTITARLAQLIESDIESTLQGRAVHEPSADGDANDKSISDKLPAWTSCSKPGEANIACIVQFFRCQHKSGMELIQAISMPCLAQKNKRVARCLSAKQLASTKRKA